MKLVLRSNLMFALAALALLSTINDQLSAANAQGTAFTYQGQLQNSNGPVYGTYNLQFTLYASAIGGTAIAGPVTNSAVAITNGLFTVTMDFGSGPWDGESNWLQIAVETNSAGATFTSLTPRQQVTPLPYTIYAEDATMLASGAALGSGSGGSIANGDSDAFIGGGNANTIPGGASDAFIGGGENNTAGGGAATVGGGALNTASGSFATVGGGDFNTANDAYTTVGGGSYNFAGDELAMVGGGADNVAGAYGSFIGGGGYNGSTFEGNNNQGNAAAIVGGLGNQILAGANGAFIGGGQSNTNGGILAVIGGGWNNTAGGEWATVGGGGGNNASGEWATVGGGQNNTASEQDATVGGGVNNTASGYNATVSGGWNNAASGFDAMVGGGSENTAGNENATVGGGNFNTAGGELATVSGGQNNIASGSGSFIGGGGWDGNYISGNTNEGNAAAITGGVGNFIQSGGAYAFIGGGEDNTASGSCAMVSGGLFNTASGTYAMVSGGEDSTASGDYSFAAGHEAQAINQGTFVWADSQYGFFSSSANNQFLIRAQNGVGINTTNPLQDLSVNGGMDVDAAANDNGTVSSSWTLLFGGGQTGEGIGSNRADTSAKDAYSLDFYTDYYRRMTILQNGDVGIGTNAPDYPLEMDSGAYCSAGGAWISASDRNVKERFAAINPRDVLEKVSTLPITEWQYKAEAEGVRHLGPMAQDFHAAFGLNGADDKHIATVDEDGVALAAIQGLNEKVENGKQKIEELQTENTKLQMQIAELQSELAGLQKAVASLADKSTATLAANVPSQGDK